MEAKRIILLVLVGALLLACNLLPTQPAESERELEATIAAQAAELERLRSGAKVGITIGPKPEEIAAAAFGVWAQKNGVPYKEAQLKIVQKDGVFATVRVTAKFKAGPDSPWLEHQADVQCRRVGGEWRADAEDINVELTEAEQEKQRKRVVATSTAAAQVWSATAAVEAAKAATVAAEQATATAEALATQAAAPPATETAVARAAAIADAQATETVVASGWQPAGLPEECVSSLAVASDGTLYAGTLYDHGIFRSDDGGTSWRAVNNGLGDLTISKVIVAPKAGDHIYASTDPGLWYSNDKGETWQHRAGGRGASWYGARRAESVALGTDDGKVVYCSSHLWFHRVEDYGRTWFDASLNGYVEQIHLVHSAPSKLDRVFAAGYSRLARSDDGGLTWWETARVGAGYPLTTLSVDASDPDIVYVGTREHGIYKSTDGGGSWTPVNNTLPNQGDGLTASALATSPTRSGWVFAALRDADYRDHVDIRDGVYFSSDGGEIWETLVWSEAFRSPPSIRSLAIAPDTEAVYVGTDGFGVWKHAAPSE